MTELKFDGARYEGGCLCLHVTNPAAARQFVRTIRADRPYMARLSEYRQRRSLDANAYAWVLIGKIAEATGAAVQEVYRETVRSIGGNSYIVPIRADAAGRYKQIWSANGLGWLCDDLGACRHTPGYVNIQCYYGSSVYDTRQMSRLIDLLVQECRQLDIETLPPDKLAAMKEEWE